MTGIPAGAAHRLIDAMRGGLIVSCQAPDGHPMRDTATIVRMALAGAMGGAVAIRCGGYGGVADVQAVVRAVDLPVIGLTKDGMRGVYITPSVAAVVAVPRAGAHLVAFDATDRPRPDDSTVSDSVAAAHAEGVLAMADVATVDEARAAFGAGADLISTTLAGYTTPGPTPKGPDVTLIGEIRAALPEAFVIAEGRYHSPDNVAAALRQGADAVVVGTAITDPVWITRRFAQAAQQASGPGP